MKKKLRKFVRLESGSRYCDHLGNVSPLFSYDHFQPQKYRFLSNISNIKLQTPLCNPSNASSVQYANILLIVFLLQQSFVDDQLCATTFDNLTVVDLEDCALPWRKTWWSGWRLRRLSTSCQQLIQVFVIISVKPLLMFQSYHDIIKNIDMYWRVHSYILTPRIVNI